jgi:hypothetical protein
MGKHTSISFPFSFVCQMKGNVFQQKYHTISIRNNLPRIPKCYQEEPLQDLPPNEFWMKKLDSSGESTAAGEYEIQYNIINGPCTCTSVLIHHFYKRIFLDTSKCVNHPILTAFLHAYNSHEDVILSPDDIWLMICIYFSKYVNQNSTKLEHLYISDQTNRLITVENEETIESE